ncbi:class I SAM-dependent methyltransferase [Cohnella sp. CFH 77786]|uniref:class I SAM-dependent methyltransferase n=1 Tax=Cohnella sp. CFH 77786 TaxID=2662265 RepID=UPI001C610FC7|nr:class I SAM-dependent methyltransferase [Cohnella sp. CFH 77786]MBW5445565.1 class I SAM-dependent methyltransferase [Cohnella sp. CFH 77786]
MNVFWHPIIQPMLNGVRPKTIIEIGALHGHTTTHLLSYCLNAGAELYVIDPAPTFDIQAFREAYGRCFHLLLKYSLQVLHLIDQYDFVLIDGDHNWYTVYHELKTIEAMAKRTGKFPAVLVHDIEWPYGRRDLYYFPESIPEAFRHPYERKGVVPGRSGLADGGFNDGSCHAVFENGPRNGVLTAIEDFLKETDLNLGFYRALPHHGLGILVQDSPDNDRMMKKILADSGLSLS